MGRYVPSDVERVAIAMLERAGFVVVRRRSYERLHRRIHDAEAFARMADEHRASTESWALREFREARRISDRLTEVVAAAAACGVDIQDINAALEKADAAGGRGDEQPKS